MKKQMANLLAGMVLLAGAMAGFSTVLMAQDDSTRGIVAEEFVKARPKAGANAAKVPQYKMVGASAKNVSIASIRSSENTRALGITIWRLRPALASDGGPRLLEQESGETIEWTPERVASDAALRKGDRVRLSIESPRTGYLYVIDREQYANKELGEAYLIFPTSRTNNGNNQVTAGKLVDIPAQEDRPNYFTLKQSRPDQAGEVLTVLVTEKPLEGITLGPKALALTKEQVADWEKNASTAVQRYEMTGGAGKTWTKAEQEASQDGTRLLTQDDPGPQTIYAVSSKGDEPILVKVGLKYSGSAKAKATMATK